MLPWPETTMLKPQFIRIYTHVLCQRQSMNNKSYVWSGFPWQTWKIIIKIIIKFNVSSTIYIHSNKRFLLIISDFYVHFLLCWAIHALGIGTRHFARLFITEKSVFCELLWDNIKIWMKSEALMEDTFDICVYSFIYMCVVWCMMYKYISLTLFLNGWLWPCLSAKIARAHMRVSVVVCATSVYYAMPQFSVGTKRKNARRLRKNIKIVDATLNVKRTQWAFIRQMNIVNAHHK